MSSELPNEQITAFEYAIPSSPPPSTRLDHIALDLENEIQRHPHHPAGDASPEPLPAHPPVNNPPPNLLQHPHSRHPEWLSLIMSFCFVGISMAFQTIQASNHLPLSFNMASLGVVLALAAFVLSKHIPGHLRRAAQVLENGGVFLGVTAFVLDVNLTFPLCLKVITWIIYVASILALILFHYFNAYFFPPTLRME